MEDEDLRQAVFDSLIELANEYHLSGLEKPKQINIESEQFSVANGMLTPTMKIKRNQAKKMYKTKIDHLYSIPVLKSNK